MSEKQTTLNKEVTLSGRGLHTGIEVNITLKPAAASFGYKFKRIDKGEDALIPALAENVSFTERGTVLEKNGNSVSTTEHCLAALRGMSVDNCLIEIDGPEIPIFDGSAKYFIDAIEEAGIKELEEERKYFVIKKKVVYEDPETGTSIIALPYDKFAIDTHISFNSSLTLANQYATLENINDF